MPVCGTKANPFGFSPRGGLNGRPWSGASFGQPEVTVASQVLVLIGDIVSSRRLSANSVCREASTARNATPLPVLTAGGVSPQPEVTLALHVAPSITETVPSL